MRTLFIFAPCVCYCAIATSIEAAQESATNRVLTLDGQTGCMLVADSPSFHSLSNALTLELWFKAASFDANNGAVNSLMRKNVAANAENFFLRFRTIEAKPVLEFSPGKDIGVLRAAFDFKAGVWYHLAATYDGMTITAFVNGKSFAREPFSGRIQIDASELAVGRGDPEYSSGEYFDGAIDDVRIWNVARSPAEIQAALHSPLTGNQPGLVACWNFDDGTCKDLSGHGNNGALKGGIRIVPAARPAATQAAVEAPTASPSSAQAGDSARQKRLQTVEELWQTLSNIYPALEYKGIAGRSWIEPVIDRVKQVEDDRQFYELLLELMASLKDTHTRIVSYPGQPALQVPPVLLNQVEGKIAVIRADSSTGLAPGDWVLSVDDRPVHDCVASQLKTVCNSTDRGRMREACERLFAGRAGTSVAVTVQGTNQAARRLELRCEPRMGFWNEPAIASRRLGDSVGYIRISRWGGNDLVDQFDRALEQFKDCAGLIIDVRGNGGGDDSLADLVNGRLIDKPVVSSIDFWRQAGTDQFHRTVGWVKPRGPWAYRGRAAVLIDEGCASACEHFVSGIEAMGRVLLVGTPTNGAGGGPTGVTLRDGTRVRISRALGVRANGVVFEGHGIPPHIFCAPLLQDLREGRDRALELAQAWVLSINPVPDRNQSLPSIAN